MGYYYVILYSFECLRTHRILDKVMAFRRKVEIWCRISHFLQDYVTLFHVIFLKKRDVYFAFLKMEQRREEDQRMEEVIQAKKYIVFVFMAEFDKRGKRYN